jgi:hypothetical protein
MPRYRKNKGRGMRRRTTMRATGFKHLLAALAASTIALCSAGPVSAAPVPSSTAAVKAAAPGNASAVGYYGGYEGWSAVTPFYAASYYAPYVYYAPPVYYTPLPYAGPAIVYGRPVLGPDPYYPAFYPYVRSTGYYGGYWRHGRYPLGGYRRY